MTAYRDRHHAGHYSLEPAQDAADTTWTPIDNPTLEDHTIIQLRDLLKAKDLPVSGSKAELIERLTNS